MVKSIKVLVVVLSFVFLSGLAPYAQASKPKLTIGIIQYVEHQALDGAREGFIAALADNGFIQKETIEIDYQNAQADQANLSTISDRFVAKKVDLVLAIATPAAQAMAGKTSTIPILGTAITDYEVARLVDSKELPGGNVTGTSDMNPIKEQIDLLAKLVPHAKKVGVLYNSSEDNSILQARLAKDSIQALGLDYLEVTVTGSNEVQQATQSIVKRVDAIYIPTDNTFASAMPVVYGVTSHSKTPVICGEIGPVMAGGLATLGINYFDLGYQTGLMAVKILVEGAIPAEMAIETATRFDFAINGQVASEIGLEIPEDLLPYLLPENK